MEGIQRLLGFRFTVSEPKSGQARIGKYRALGQAGRDYLVVCTTWRGGARRLISAWKVDGDGQRRYTQILATLKARHDRGETETRPDAPMRPVDAAFWAKARVVMPPPGKASVHMRIDSDVLEWFRAQGKGHLTRMNAVLRSFIEAHKTGRR